MADSVVSFDSDSFFVVSFGLVVVFESPVAASHVAVGLEVVRIVHRGSNVQLYCLLVFLLVLLLLGALKGLLGLLSVDISARGTESSS